MMIAPYISREDVSAALNALIHSARRPEGLEHLLLVDLRVNAPDMPGSSDARDFAVRELLVSEIRQALADQRALFRLDPPDDHTRADDARVAVQADRDVGTSELLAWSTLYYRYVRSDLAIPVAELAALLAVDPRTISRYLDDGIEMLTHRLIAAEQQARRAQLERRLNALLPYSVPVRLFGRDDLLHSVEALLPDLSPCHLLISGAAGVGKTTFVQELLRRQIAAGHLDHLVWLDQPGTAQFAREQIAEALLREGGQVTLRDYLLLYRVAVVIDGIETAAADRLSFAALLRDLGAAFVCLISRDDLALEAVEARLTLPEIDLQAAEALIDAVLHAQHSPEAEFAHEIAPDVYERVGGNPLLLRLTAALWDKADPQTLQAAVQQRLFEQIFASLDADDQAAWCALALCPRPLQLSELSSLWAISPERIEALVRHGLVERGEDRFLLVSAAGEYVRQQASAQTFEGVIAALQPVDAAFDVRENVLITGFPVLDAAARAEWIAASWPEGIRHGHWARWRLILEQAAAPEQRVAYGVCLRHLADWEGAQQVFYGVVTECGRTGRFAEQARALVEWSVLARYQGRFANAQGLIAQARRFAQRTHDGDLLSALALQEAQILIDQGSGAQAQQMLAALPDSARVLALQSEAQLTLGQYDACRAQAQRALALIRDDQATEASLYTIVGRSYERQRDPAQAQRYFTDAVTLLERLGDAFALARAQTNLAAALIALHGRADDADLLLARAVVVQTRLGDRVGLSATRHNRAILGGDIAR